MGDATLSDFERQAVKERAAELKAQKRGGGKAKEKDLAALLERIAEMPESDRVIAEKLHEIVTEVAPDLHAKTWYSMPAYAKDGKIVVFFQAAGKFETRYATIGFNDSANLDDGTMWPVSYAITEINAANAKRIRELVEKAIS